MVAESHTWLLRTSNVASKFLTSYNLINLILSTHPWLVATVLDNEALADKQTQKCRKISIILTDCSKV